MIYPVSNLPLQKRQHLFQHIYPFIYSLTRVFSCFSSFLSFFFFLFVQDSNFYAENITFASTGSSYITVALTCISDALHKTLRAEGHDITLLIYVLRCDRLRWDELSNSKEVFVKFTANQA